MTGSLLVPTPLGNLRFRARVERAPLDLQLRLTAIPVTPVLPPGMAVSGCVGVVLECRATTSLHGLRFECAWAGDSPAPMSPANGEWLDAQAWSTDQHVVTIGTEDAERLRHRLGPDLSLGEFPERYVVEHVDAGLVITVGEAPATTALSLHCVVAWNQLPEPEECSSWFAVDVAHDLLLSSVQLGRLAA